MACSYRVLTSFIFFLVCIPSIARADSAEDYQRGLSFYNQKQYDQAIIYLKEATQLDDQNWQAFQVLGYCYYMIKDNQDALNNFDKSLEINPNNSSLKTFSDSLQAKVDMAASAPSSPTLGNPGSPDMNSPSHRTFGPKPPFIFQKGAWAHFQAGVIDASLGDLSTGAQALENSSLFTSVNASNSGVGFLLGGEAGYSFDSENAVGFAVNLGFFGGYSDQYISGGNTFADTYSPIMFEFEPLYHHYFLMGGSRLGFELGPAFYVTSLEVNSVENGTVLISGPMSGYGFGGTAGAEWDFSFKNFSINIFGHGRLASTSNIQGTFSDIYGNSIQEGLAASSQNYIGTAATSFIGTSGIRWANVDYTGFDIGLSVTYRYW